MTEAEWLACTHPAEMLQGLGRRPSKRKRRLFVCAACRHIWHLIPDKRSRSAVLVAERFADGLAGSDELTVARAEAAVVLKEQKSQRSKEWASRACYCSVLKRSGDAVKVWVSVCYALQMHELPPRTPHRDSRVDLPTMMRVWDEGFSCLVGMLRDIFGPLPFRAVFLDPAWHTPTVMELARASYDKRSLPAGTLDTSRRAVLADALEDAGCDNADILGHLRGPGPHVRGCWVVDLILGKQ